VTDDRPGPWCAGLTDDAAEARRFASMARRITRSLSLNALPSRYPSRQALVFSSRTQTKALPLRAAS
jgi:hypothetical protein